MRLLNLMSNKLTGYILDDNNSYMCSNRRPAVIICPGGAYAFKSNRESENVAMRFLAAGYNAFVLNYSTIPAHFPTALYELADAVELVRSNCDEYNIPENKIFVCGFSAGGHLAACLGVLWNSDIMRIHCSDVNLIRPDGMILAYPVISSGEYAHTESFTNLLGEHPDSNMLNQLSLENSVDSNCVPAFIWHTCEDDTVPVENSLLFAMALKKHHIPVELHIYQHGIHGTSLCDTTSSEIPEQISYHNSGWIKLAIDWISPFPDGYKHI